MSAAASLHLLCDELEIGRPSPVEELIGAESRQAAAS